MPAGYGGYAPKGGQVQMVRNKKGKMKQVKVKGMKKMKGGKS